MSKKYIEVIYKITNDDLNMENIFSPKLRTLKIEHLENYKDEFKKYIKHKCMGEVICILIKGEKDFKKSRNMLLDIVCDGLDALEDKFDNQFKFKIEVSDIRDL